MTASGCGTILIIIFLLAGIQFIAENKLVFMAIFLALIAIWLFVRLFSLIERKHIRIFPKLTSEKIPYALDEKEKAMWAEFLNAFSVLGSYNKIWIITESTPNEVPRYEEGGASSTFSRKSTVVAKYVKAHTKNSFAYLAEEDSFTIGSIDGGIVFLPKEVRIYLNTSEPRFISTNYNSIRHSFTYSNVIESGDLPSDAEIDHYTWKHVNLDGSKDNRYKSNQHIPVCRYGKIIFSTDETKLILQLSRASDIRKLEIAFSRYVNFLLDKMPLLDSDNELFYSATMQTYNQGTDSSYSLDELEDLIAMSNRQASASYQSSSIKDSNCDTLQSRDLDDYLDQAVAFALQDGQISTSTLQRRLNIGYARAGRITDRMEELGIVSAKVGAHPRVCLITQQEWNEMKRSLNL